MKRSVYVRSDHGDDFFADAYCIQVIDGVLHVLDKNIETIAAFRDWHDARVVTSEAKEA